MDPTWRKPPLINFGLIQLTSIPGMKPLSCPYIVTTKGGQEQFPGKRAAVFLRPDAAATRFMFLCGYYSRAAFVSMESPQRSMMAG